MKAQPIIFHVNLKEPYTHIIEMICQIPNPQKKQLVSLPTWTLGSYLIRDFAKQVVQIQSKTSFRKLNKHTWEFDTQGSALEIRYEVYAFDPSIRGVYFDQFMCLLNGTSIFLKPHGFEKHDFQVQIHLESPAIQNWTIETTLPSLSSKNIFTAKDYDELVDHPFLLGNLQRHRFMSSETPHEFILDAKYPGDFKRICDDLSKICQTHIQLFQEKPPFDFYKFLARVEEDGYGGLEHRASSMLLCKPTDFPKTGSSEMPEHYRSFLGLCSHEYFHAWNVKRLKPQAFVNPDYEQECYTTLLWVFEGITSYYDDLALVRSQVISKESYLDLLSKAITRVLYTPGRQVQNLADSSFDTWIKFYRPDENTPNSQISYYLKGGIVALALDLTIRIQTKNQKSLDDVMRYLWNHKTIREQGIGEAEFESVCEEVSGISLKAFFDEAIRGIKDIQLEPLLKEFGVSYKLKQENSSQVYLGARIKKTDQHDVVLQTVLIGSPAMNAGLASGDSILSLDDVQVKSHTYESILSRYQAGEKARYQASRRGHIFSGTILFENSPEDVCQLDCSSNMTKTQKKLQDSWLFLS